MSLVTGFLLAGGKSSRMGRDKALLELDGETLAELGLRKLRTVCGEVAIAGGGAELARFAVIVPDGRPGCGPLGGIVAALESSATEWNLFLAVDMPFVPVEVLHRLLDSAHGRSKVILSEVEGQLHPLCGVYARTALPVLRRELEAGRYKVRDAIEATDSFAVMRFEDVSWFRNVNTPQEFAAISDTSVWGRVKA